MLRNKNRGSGMVFDKIFKPITNMESRDDLSTDSPTGDTNNSSQK